MRPRNGSYSPPAGSEQRCFARCGPHEIWDDKLDPEAARAAQDQVDRLRAADEAAAELTGEASTSMVLCEGELNGALEVIAVDPQGRVIVGLRIELHREGRLGILAATTGTTGAVRFEGLLDGDRHALWIPSVVRAAWRVSGSEALPGDRATARYQATWSGTSARADRPPAHEVSDGECMWTLARRYGLEVEALWAANAALGATGRSAKVLAPGDVISLPPAQDEALAPVGVGQRVTVACNEPVVRAKLRLLDIDGEPRAGLSALIQIKCHDGRESAWETTTDGDGCIDEAVPADARTLDLILAVEPEPQAYHFSFAYLDPIETIAGVQGRLANLGYHCGSERGELGPLTTRALREFQAETGLAETGAIDGPTKQALEALY